LRRARARPRPPRRLRRLRPRGEQRLPRRRRHRPLRRPRAQGRRAQGSHGSSRNIGGGWDRIRERQRSMRWARQLRNHAMNLKDIDFKQLLIEKGERIGLIVAAAVTVLLVAGAGLAIAFNVTSPSKNSGTLKELRGKAQTAWQSSKPPEGLEQLP